MTVHDVGDGDLHSNTKLRQELQTTRDEVVRLKNQIQKLRAQSVLDQEAITEFSKLKEIREYSELYWQIDSRIVDLPRAAHSRVRLDVLDQVMDELLQHKQRADTLQDWLSGNPHCLPTFMQEEVLDWMFSKTRPARPRVKAGNLHLMGGGPWEHDSFGRLMERQNFSLWELPDADIAHVIVGRNNWDQRSLLAQIEARKGKKLRIYSQEMWFATLTTGRDPFDSGDRGLLTAFAKGHPALEFLISSVHPWPQPSARQHRTHEASGMLLRPN